MGGQAPAWRPLTSDERRRGVFAAVQAASAVLGPWGPLVAWGVEIAYDRRDVIFDWLGGPAQAVTADGSALPLSSLVIPGRTARTGTLSVDVPLTFEAQRIGLRKGDPVSVVLSGHEYVQARSGLVVPTRIGERVRVTVPSGNYSLAAIGSRGDALYATPDPYTTMAGGNILLPDRREVVLRLAARNAAVGGPYVSPARADVMAQLRGMGNCGRCGNPVGGSWLRHAGICPNWVYTCDRCRQTFRSSDAFASHKRRAHSLWGRLFE
jgi:hypothetical protein